MSASSLKRTRPLKVLKCNAFNDLYRCWLSLVWVWLYFGDESLFQLLIFYYCSKMNLNQKEKARIVEAAEAAYLAASFSLAPADVAKELGMKVFQVWGGVASLMANDPTGGFWSRVIGIGIVRPISVDFLEAIESLYITNGCKVATVQVSPLAQPENFEDLLSAAGFVKGHSWIKLLRELNDIPDVESDLEVREIETSAGDEYGRVYWDGFGLPDPTLQKWMSAHVGKPDWKIYGAFDGATMVGVGALYLRGDVACLSGAATLESHRNRGAQSALMVARLRAASELDLSWASTETGSESEGEPNPSLHNMRRLGFEEVYQRYNWVKRYNQ